MVYFALFLVFMAFSILFYLIWTPSFSVSTESKNWYEPILKPFRVYSQYFLTWSYRFKIEKLLLNSRQEKHTKVEHFVLIQILGAFCCLLGVFILDLFYSLSFLSFCFVLCFCIWFGFYYPIYQLKVKIRKRLKSIEYDFPFFIDMFTIALESGMGFQSAFKQTVELFPNHILKEELEQVYAELQLGLSKQEVFEKLNIRVSLESIEKWTQSILHADKMGMSLGRLMRALSTQSRDKRFEEAEKKAMKMPVKMIFPLVVFFFPCTFIILLFPVIQSISLSGGSL